MTSSLQDKILTLNDQLTESERRLAAVTLECIGNLAAYSATELAQKAGVSKATAGRFFRRLGYENFNEVRALLRDEADRGSPLYELAGVQAPVDDQAPLARHLANDLQNLAQTFDRLHPADVERAVALFAGAGRVFIAGFRNGRVLAQYAWALLTQLRPGVTLAPGAGLNLAEDLADLGADDVLLVMDFRRRVTLLWPMVAHANRVGAKVVILTDPSATDLPARSDVVLRCVNHGAAVFDSYVAAVSLINHLCTSLALILGDAARDRLEEIESLHDHYGDLHR
ncbi:MurR/RpiR family transcriptional regulator [Cupriavidus alkaliphilus]|uniref:DNA-binding MurR/RpiR family transcriptional regulator n=1 Tax=Cupriavidus alkaliphilus TaxID=942866 RepID=A0A7W4VEC3_9BURK|nr:MurR/RpiR family transcriptional regulator [Cupriavidus alkaliphilus]MBB3010027.1 DNA-binding MurR/RpiR family transcriptional regulator [Cupriavidus alkaliphilus]